ncbi:hypothetical protein FEP47_04849 [Burkholderia multivorans]|nr:hypothetical protein [Burkholderia multivorans]
MGGRHRRCACVCRRIRQSGAADRDGPAGPVPQRHRDRGDAVARSRRACARGPSAVRREPAGIHETRSEPAESRCDADGARARRVGGRDRGGRVRAGDGIGGIERRCRVGRCVGRAARCVGCARCIGGLGGRADSASGCIGHRAWRERPGRCVVRRAVVGRGGRAWCVRGRYGVRGRGGGRCERSAHVERHDSAGAVVGERRDRAIVPNRAADIRRARAGRCGACGRRVAAAAV